MSNYNDTIEARICQVVNKSLKILHYDFVSGETSIESHACNMAFVYAIKHGYDPESEFVYVTSELPKKDAEKLLAWQEACGTHLTFSGVDYAPLCLTSSGGKSCESIWCNKGHLREYSRAFRMELGKKGFKMEPNKLFTRMGLFFSSAKPLDFDIDYNKINVVTDIKKNGANRSDGITILFVDSEEEAAKVRNAFTMRPLKGLVVVVYKDKFIELVGNQEITTIFGSRSNLSNTQLLSFESCFKFASMRESEQQFIEQVKENGLFVAVNMNKHDTKWLTYQPLHTLPFADADINTLADENIRACNQLSNIENYIKLAPRNTRKAVSIYPALAKDSYVEKEAQVGYRKFRTTARGGALHAAGSFKAICPDIIDLFGKDNLKAGECSCNALPEGDLIMIRYPHTSVESWVVLKNKHVDMGIVDEHVLVLNNYDDSAARLGGADFDGDKVFVVENKLYEEVILKTLEKAYAPHIEAPEGHANVKEFNAKTAEYIKQQFFGNLVKRNQIGVYANRLAKAFALFYEAASETECNDAMRYIEFWTKMVLIEVDKEKHGSTYLDAPSGAYELGSLPNFIKYAKLAKHIGNNSTFELDPDSYAERIACPLEKYSKRIAANTPMMKDFHVDISGEFDWRNLLIHNGKELVMPPKMFSRNEVVREYGRVVKDANGKPVYKDGGYLDRIVFADSETIKKWAESMEVNTEGSVDEIRTELLRATMEKLSKQFGMDKVDVYNATVAYIYGYIGKDEGANAYKRVFWNTYADEAVAALEARFGAPKFKVEELADIEDEYVDDEEMPW